MTINNTFNSNVIAVIPPRVPDKASAEINIFMGTANKKEPQENMSASKFSEVAARSNKLNALTVGLAEGDKERVMDRLLQSVNMVKEVLQSNLKLREQVQDQSQRLDQQNAELFHLQCENEEQREKISIMAGIKPDPVLPVSQDLRRKANEEEPPPAAKRIDVAEEILQLKRDKSMLEQRVHYLELENIDMHTSSPQAKRPSMPGTDDFEPVRSVLNGADMRMARISKSTNGRRPVKRPRMGPPRTSYAEVRSNSRKATSML